MNMSEAVVRFVNMVGGDIVRCHVPHVSILMGYEWRGRLDIRVCGHQLLVDHKPTVNVRQRNFHYGDKTVVLTPNMRIESHGDYSTDVVLRFAGPIDPHDAIAVIGRGSIDDIAAKYLHQAIDPRPRGPGAIPRQEAWPRLDDDPRDPRDR